jgi:hypothetical protein
MTKQRLTPHNPRKGSQKSPTQWQRALAEWKKAPATMKMVSVATGIDRANLCRLVAVLERAGVLCLRHKSLCSITKHRAGYYLAKDSEQQTLL